MTAKKTKGLGRGLEALLGGDRAVDPDPGSPAAPTSLPLDWLQPGRYQPRTRMDEASLQDLASSIRSHGLMQPIVVRTIGPRRYEIIAGERRFRAARIAGLQEVPVMLREVSDQNALAMALIENIQREDLNPLEEAQAIQRLLDEFGFTHEQASEAIGRSRSATSNLLRLLNLAQPVQTMLLAGDLEMGHARALLALDRAQQVLTATRVIEKRLTVRETEKLVALTLAQSGTEGAETGSRPLRRQTGGRDVERLRDRLADRLATPVELRVDARGKGRLVIHFGNADQFDGLLGSLGLKEVLVE